MKISTMIVLAVAFWVYVFAFAFGQWVSLQVQYE
jgi:hypothetical protein